MVSLQFNEITYDDSKFSILLRPLAEADAEVIHSAVLLSQANLRPFMDWSHRETSVEQQKERIRISQTCFSKGLSYDFIVVDRESNDFLMSASLHASRVPNKKSLGIGYWTSSKYCNQGLASIVTMILTSVAIEIFGCDRVEIGCNKANLKSLRVIEKCGFKKECEAKNYFSEPTLQSLQNGFNPERTGLLYALTKEEAKEQSWYDSITNKLSII